MSENIELAEFVEVLQEWHIKVIEQLKLISDSKTDTSLDLAGTKIDGKSDMAKGIRIGVAIAVDQFELPFTVTKKGEDNG